MRKRHGFTLIELLVVMAIIALLLGLLLPALAKARATARQVKDATQINQIYKGWLVYSTEKATDSLPLPGLINRVGTTPGRGKEDTGRNSHDNLYAACVTLEYIGSNILVSPSESSGNVVANPIYNTQAYSPINDIYWDDDPGTGMKANLQGTCHTSYGTCLLHGERKAREWSNRLNSRFPLVGNRGVRDSSYADNDYLASKTLKIHGGAKAWVGNIVFGDGHAELVDNFFPQQLGTIGSGSDAINDGLFSLETAGDGTGGDAFLCVVDDTGQTTPQDNGTAQPLDWESSIKWD